MSYDPEDERETKFYEERGDRQAREANDKHEAEEKKNDPNHVRRLP